MAEFRYYAAWAKDHRGPNGQTISNDQEIPGITGGALDSHEEMPGPIYLQGSEKGHVAYRNIVITPARQ